MQAGQACTLGILRSQDRGSRERFVNANYDDVFRWIHWLTNDRERAADLTQETFLRFWESFDSGKSSMLARIWLFAVGRNVWRNFCRRRSRDARISIESVGEDALPEACGGRTPFESLAASECADEIREAVANLRPDYQEALTLRYWQDLSYSEITQILNISSELARQRVFQGRKLLREQLRAWAPETKE